MAKYGKRRRRVREEAPVGLPTKVIEGRPGEGDARTGLASNDVLAMYVAASGSAFAAFLAENSSAAANEYRDATRPGGDEPDAQPEKVGQVGLLYNSQFTSARVSFNQTSEAEKDDRELAIVNLLRTARDRAERGQLPIKFDVRVTSLGAGSVTPTEKQDQATQNAECKAAQDAWWKARYEMTTLLTGESDEQHRHLPLSFYLEGVDSKGTRIKHYGAVKRLVVEADKNVLAGTPGAVSGAALKMYFTLVDTNWENEAANVRPSRAPAQIDLIARHQASRCVSSAIVRGEQTFDVFVSSFAFRLESAPVSISTDVRRRFMGDGLTLVPGDAGKDTSGLSIVRFHANRHQTLAFLSRALPVLHRRLRFGAVQGEPATVIEGETPERPLPLVLSVRSTEPVNPEGDRHVEAPVMSMMLRYNAQPLDFGDLGSDPAFVRAAQFRLADGNVVAQDANNKSVWYFNSRAIQGEPTIDLAILSHAPRTKRFRLQEPVKSVVNGAHEFYWFRSPAAANQRVSLSKDDHDATLASDPTTPVNSLLVSVPGEDGVPKLPPLAGPYAWLVPATQMALLAIGWSVAEASMFSSVAKLACVVCAVVAASAALLAVADGTAATPEAMRGYERLLFPAVLAAAALAGVALFFSLRYRAELSYSTLVAVATASFCASVLLVMEGATGRDGPYLSRLRFVALLVLALSLGLVAIEMRKLERAAEVDAVPPPRLPLFPTALPVNALAAVTLAAAAAGTWLGRRALLDAPPDNCNQLEYLAEAGARGERESKEPAAKSFYREQMERADIALDGCSAMAVPQWATNGITPVLALAAVICAIYAATEWIGVEVARRSPSRFDVGGAILREDGRTKRSVWTLKSMLGVLVLAAVAWALYPLQGWDDGRCEALRDRIDRAETIADASPVGPVAHEAAGHLAAIRAEALARGCRPRSSSASSLATTTLALLLACSFIVPQSERFVRARSSAAQAAVLLATTSAIGVGALWVANRDNRLKLIMRL